MTLKSIKDDEKDQKKIEKNSSEKNDDNEDDIKFKIHIAKLKAMKEFNSRR